MVLESLHCDRWLLPPSSQMIFYTLKTVQQTFLMSSLSTSSWWSSRARSLNRYRRKRVALHLFSSGGDCLKIKSPNSRFIHVCQFHEWLNYYRFSLEPTDIWFLRYRPIMAISNPKITVLSSFARGRNGLLYLNGYWELFLIADSSSSSRIHRMQTSALSFFTKTEPDFSGFFYQPTMGGFGRLRNLQPHSIPKEVSYAPLLLRSQ